MHEISLVRNIFRSLESEYTPEQIEEIKTIHLKIGLLSNVQTILLNNAFDAVVSTDFPQFKHTVLDVESITVKIHCCDTDTEIENYKFVCSICGKPSNNIIQGDELLISGVSMRG